MISGRGKAPKVTSDFEERKKIKLRTGKRGGIREPHLHKGPRETLQGKGGKLSPFWGKERGVGEACVSHNILGKGQGQQRLSKSLKKLEGESAAREIRESPVLHAGKKDDDYGKVARGVSPGLCRGGGGFHGEKGGGGEPE